ncbi:uncharacterized protein LOC119189952 [Manduca sexta]|uniref:uncharacterized protein LOC119189952 n=1 Tax=Manduca sexta TaxID=7130 RepID=UPI00188DDFBE|nr:uncharacterized protein LOC119189952 [Manduca sexta]
MCDVGHRVVIPVGCREKVLNIIHEPHMGIVKSKALARSYVWWPGIDEAVEQACGACGTCAAFSDAPPRATPHPWPWPTRPWTRVHLDYMGPIAGKLYLVVVDAMSKWLEVFSVPSTAAGSTIAKLHELWSRFGIPKQIVTDNGPPFTSDIIKPDRENNVHRAQQRQTNDARGENRSLKVGERIWYRQHSMTEKWVPGTVAKATGVRDFKVLDKNSKVIHRHIDQLKPRCGSLVIPTSSRESRPNIMGSSRENEATPVQERSLVTGSPISPSIRRQLGVGISSPNISSANEHQTQDEKFSTPPTTPVLSQSRPLRKCRLEKIVSYKE